MKSKLNEASAKATKTKLAVFDCDSRGMFIIHAADCADCARDAKRGDKGFPLKYRIEEHVSALDLSKSIWSDMIVEGSMTAEEGLAELDIKPCVKFA